MKTETEVEEEKCVRGAMLFHARNVGRQCQWPEQYRMVAWVAVANDVQEVLELSTHDESGRWCERAEVVSFYKSSTIRPTTHGDVVLFDGDCYLCVPQGLVETRLFDGELVAWKRELPDR